MDVTVDLDRFTRQYVETLLWSETRDDGQPMDADHDRDDISAEALQQIVAECASFQHAFADVIEAAAADVRCGPDCRDAIERAGHDFCLTRNGHGAGFWDGAWPEPAASILTQASAAYGEMSAYVGDDGRIYVS